MVDAACGRIADELCAFLCREVLPGVAEVPRDAVLSELGVDSFALMELVLFVERRFGVVLSMSDLTPDNVRSVRALSATLHRAGLSV